MYVRHRPIELSLGAFTAESCLSISPPDNPQQRTSGLTEIAGDALTDTRRGKNGRHGLVGQFRQSFSDALVGPTT